MNKQIQVHKIENDDLLQQIQHNEENNVTNLNTLRNENIELTENIKKLKKEYEQLENEHNEIGTKYNDLINQLSLKDDEISQLESDKKEAVSQFTEINQKNLQKVCTVLSCVTKRWSMNRTAFMHCSKKRRLYLSH